MEVSSFDNASPGVSSRWLLTLVFTDGSIRASGAQPTSNEFILRIIIWRGAWGVSERCLVSGGGSLR